MNLKLIKEMIIKIQSKHTKVYLNFLHLFLLLVSKS